MIDEKSACVHNLPLNTTHTYSWPHMNTFAWAHTHSDARIHVHDHLRPLRHAAFWLLFCCSFLASLLLRVCMCVCGCRFRQLLVWQKSFLPFLAKLNDKKTARREGVMKDVTGND